MRSTVCMVVIWVLGASGCSQTSTEAVGEGSGGSTTPQGATTTGGAAGVGAGPGRAGAAQGGAVPPPADEDFSPRYGRYGEAENTFILERPAGDSPRLRYDDLVSELPEVDWQQLDRLYLPAGEYDSIYLGGLPERSAERPLVVTNWGGQVKIGGGGVGYNLSLQGGSNWILTGRYDPDSGTGDSEFRGHAEGTFAHSQGSYGIFVDDAFSQTGLSGIYIGSFASDFELDCLEITRAEFAGISAKTDDEGGATMKNVRMHDVYIHDVGSEGIYFGSTQAQPQHAFEGLQIYDNRIVRTGTEALQVGQLGDDCEIHHNVIGPGAIRFRSAFQTYQDGNVQLGQRYGSSHFHHNVVVGAGDLFVEFFPTAVDSDPHGVSDTVTFSDNYFADTSQAAVYTHATANSVSVHFVENAFRGFFFNYDEVYPDKSEPGAIFSIGSNTENPHLLRDNVFDAPWPFLQWSFPSVTEQGNSARQLSPLRFFDFINPDIEGNFRLLEWWTDTATLHPDNPPVIYEAGSFVMHEGSLYEAVEQNSGEPPGKSSAWRQLAPPADDARVVGPGSASADYPGTSGVLGVRWPPPVQ